MRLDNKHGFTLMELMVVIAIIGIMAAIAIPNFLNWLPNMRLKAAARDLYSNMQRTRMMAVKTNKKTAIIFKPANNTYDICDDWNSTATTCTIAVRSVSLTGYKSGVGYGHGSAAQAVPGGAFPAGDVSYNPPPNTLIFTSRGLGTGGYVYLDHQKNTTTYGVATQTSGVIQLKRWQGSSWK